MDSTFPIDGKVIFVSGATGVLGWTYVEHFNALGARVVVADLEARQPVHRALQLAEKGRGDVLGVTCDVSSEREVTDAINATVEHFGRIDAVINNAAATGEFLNERGEVFAAFEDYPLDVWKAVLDTNLTGTFLIAREGGKAMRRSGGGSLVNVSSIYGLVAPDHRIYEGLEFNSFPPYAASKAGVHGLTMWLSTYWALSGIRVNTVFPGGVFNHQAEEFVERYSDRTPMGRMANREDLVGIMLYLISDASSYVTGQKFVVDGGLSVW